MTKFTVEWLLLVLIKILLVFVILLYSVLTYEKNNLALISMENFQNFLESPKVFNFFRTHIELI